MQPLKELREKIGFTQSEMAQCLGISLAQYAMAELGKRRIPVKANQRLEFLQNQITAALTLPLPDQVVEAQKIHDRENHQILLDHAHFCRNAAKGLRKNMAKLWLQNETLELIARFPTSGKESTAHMQLHELFIEVKRRESIEKLAYNKGSKELLLQLQIEMLEEEAIRATKKAGELSN